MLPAYFLKTKLLPPRLVRLSEEQRREAVALLADLLLEAARKRARVSGGGSDGVISGAIPSSRTAWKATAS